jgi:hypothetical protein
MKKKENTFKFPDDQRNFGGVESDSIKKYGWYAHYVFDETDCPFGTNIHTHGIKENFGHLDLQVCIAIPQQIAHGILWAAFRLIESGETLKPGKEYDYVLTGYKVKAILAREGERDVIRIVLPAKDGTYTGQFAEQLKKTGREKIN